MIFARELSNDLFLFEMAKMISNVIHDLKLEQQQVYLQTWQTILKNIQDNPSSEKFKTLRPRNKFVSSRLTCVQGTEDLFLFLGVRKQIRDFEESFVFDHVKEKHIGLGLDVIGNALKDVDHRLGLRNSAKGETKKSEEAKRRDETLIQIQADRLAQKERLEREKRRREFLKNQATSATTSVPSSPRPPVPPRRLGTGEPVMDQPMFHTSNSQLGYENDDFNDSD